eukprot:3741275-Rhodomonas_salina.1
MACMLAVALPTSVTRKLYLFYRKVDIEMKIIEVLALSSLFQPFSSPRFYLFYPSASTSASPCLYILQRPTPLSLHPTHRLSPTPSVLPSPSPHGPPFHRSMRDEEMERMYTEGKLGLGDEFGTHTPDLSHQQPSPRCPYARNA